MSKETASIPVDTALYLWHKVGYSPNDSDPWNLKPPDLTKFFLQRGIEMQAKGAEMVAILADLYGPDSTQAVGAYVHNRLVESVSQIAASQILNYQGKPLSWLDYNMLAGKALQREIARLTRDIKFKRFWDENPEFRQTLLIVGRQLSEEYDPTQFDSETKDSISHRLEALAAESYRNNHAIILFLWGDDWVDPGRCLDQRPQIWVARSHLMLPLPQNQDLRAREAGLTSDLRLIYGLDPNDNVGPAILGVSLAGAGGESALATGEALDHKGFMFSINTLYTKKAWAYKATRQIFGEGTTGELFNATVRLNVAHERGHEAESEKINAFGAEKEDIETRIKYGLVNQEDVLRLRFLSKYLSKTRIVDEITADIPAVIATFENLGNQRYDMTELDYQLALRNLIQACVIEYVTEGVMTSPDSGEVFGGYRISGINLINTMFKEGVITRDGKSSQFRIDSSPSRLSRFLTELKNNFKGLSDNDPKVIDALKNEEMLPETKKLGDLFAAFKSHYQRLG